MENTKFAEVMGAIVARVLYWLVSTAFILWGWNVLAPPPECPLVFFLGDVCHSYGFHIFHFHSLAEGWTQTFS